MSTRTYDWEPRHDERSREYPLRNLLAPSFAVATRSKNWRCLPRLDQGEEGACVGFGVAHALGGYPAPQPVSDAFARLVYDNAKRVDEWEGEAYEGTSVLAGAKAARTMGRVSSFYWAVGIDDVLAALSWVGDVVLGVWWKAGMEDPDADGTIHNTGRIRGGHCVAAHGINTKLERVRIRNSWGRGWGLDGDCFLSFADLDALLAEDGEACVMVKRPQEDG